MVCCALLLVVLCECEVIPRQAVATPFIDLSIGYGLLRSDLAPAREFGNAVACGHGTEQPTYRIARHVRRSCRKFGNPVACGYGAEQRTFPESHRPRHRASRYQCQSE
jgi:hypothetical protein